MPRTSAEYGRLAKYGFLLGVALLVGGFAAEAIGHAVYGTFPAWEDTLFTDAEIAGILVGLFAPVLFGGVLPLIE